jgi:hypothetical protein
MRWRAAKGKYVGAAGRAEPVAAASYCPVADPSPAYRGLVSRVSQKTIALGDYRLGATLNGIFDP